MLKQKPVFKIAILTTLTVSVFVGGISCVSAGTREQAKRIHDRLAGVPPSASVLDAMESDIATGGINGLETAAYRAMENSAFYNVTLKNFVTPWTNKDQTVFAPLNDYTATVIGMIRDDEPFNAVLSADVLYVGSTSGLPPYSMSNNSHYQALEDQAIDLKTDLAKTTQSGRTTLPASATAGVMTTRAGAEAFFFAGTNRAMFRFTMLNYLCRDLEQVKDITRSPDRIRQDVSRSPGGDSRIFLNSCIGCHSGMDGLAGAFAYYEWDDNATQLVYTPGAVQGKHLINADNFKYGYVTIDDSWTNYWRNGQNALLGWDELLPAQGNGAKSLGQELANTDAFAECQVTKVFKTVCLREPGNASDRTQIAQMASNFKANGYKMKQVFAEAAVYCMGD
jgi:hypothetical protein